MCSYKTYFGVHEINYKTLTKQLLCDFFGVLVYVSLAVFASTKLTGDAVGIALANGLLIVSVVHLTGHISGGHLNPVVTLEVLFAGQITMLRARAEHRCYILCQVLGSIVGAAVSYVITTAETRGNLGVTIPIDDLTVAATCGLEFAYDLSISGCCAKRYRYSPGGQRYRICTIIYRPYYNCLPMRLSILHSFVNPVKSLGPAVIMNPWTHLWIYWIGPSLGGIVAGLVFRFVLYSVPDE